MPKYYYNVMKLHNSIVWILKFGWLLWSIKKIKYFSNLDEVCRIDCVQLAMADLSIIKYNTIYIV